MAIVKGPLFSLSASGKIADSLVFMTWKGINDVRKYVIPANPNSANQQTQRGYLRSLVTLWHAIDWNAADQTAFNTWASIANSAMSGFNRWIKEGIDAFVLGKEYRTVSALVVSAVLTTSFTVTAAAVVGLTFTLNYGTSPTAMVETAAVANVAGVLTANLAALTADTTYYFQIVETDVGNVGKSGIGKQKTAAA